MRAATTALLGGLVAVSLAVLAGCSATSAAQPDAVSSVRAGTPATASASDDGALGTPADPARVAIVGDSLTAGGARLLSSGLTAKTWMTYAKGNGIDYVGGWAKGGTPVQVQAAHVRPITDVDVLVLMSGTNDVRLHIPFAKAAASYDKIVATIHAKHVIVAAIPPYDRNPTGAAVYERELRAYVEKKEGWDFVDPWGFARDGLVYKAGVSKDGIHPLVPGYKKLGENLRADILRVVSKPVAG